MPRSTRTYVRVHKATDTRRASGPFLDTQRHKTHCASVPLRAVPRSRSPPPGPAPVDEWSPVHGAPRARAKSLLYPTWLDNAGIASHIALRPRCTVPRAASENTPIRMPSAHVVVSSPSPLGGPRATVMYPGGTRNDEDAPIGLQVANEATAGATQLHHGLHGHGAPGVRKERCLSPRRGAKPKAQTLSRETHGENDTPARRPRATPCAARCPKVDAHCSPLCLSTTRHLASADAVPRAASLHPGPAG